MQRTKKENEQKKNGMTLGFSLGELILKVHGKKGMKKRYHNFYSLQRLFFYSSPQFLIILVTFLKQIN